MPAFAISMAINLISISQGLKIVNELGHPCRRVGLVEGEVVEIEAGVTIVVGDKPLLGLPPREVLRAGLTANVAIVMSTYRSNSVDMVLDHRLWVSCAHAVMEFLKADEARVFHDIRRTFVSRILGTPWPREIGTLEAYADSLIQDGEAPSWGLLVWRRDGSIVGAATSENWYRVGGPEPYHDSYTTRVFVPPTSIEALVARLRSQFGGLEAGLAIFNVRSKQDGLNKRIP